VTDLDLINPDLLPPQARTIAKLIGVAEMVVLLTKRGGTQLRVPVHADRCVVLKEILKPESIELLVKHFPDQRLELPKADKALQQLRDIAVHNALKQKTAPEVALQFNLSRQWVFAIKRKQKQEKPNLDLFDGLDSNAN